MSWADWINNQLHAQAYAPLHSVAIIINSAYTHTHTLAKQKEKLASDSRKETKKKIRYSVQLDIPHPLKLWKLIYVKIGSWCEQYAQCVHIAETYALQKSSCSIRRQHITRRDSCHGDELQQKFNYLLENIVHFTLNIVATISIGLTKRFLFMCIQHSVFGFKTRTTQQ